MHATRDIIVRTPDLAVARSLYDRHFGSPFLDEPTLIGYDLGGLRLFVEEGAAHPPTAELLVPDVAPVRDAMLADGCTLIEEDPAVPRCYVEDPFGFRFNIGRG